MDLADRSDRPAPQLFAQAREARVQPPDEARRVTDASSVRGREDRGRVGGVERQGLIAENVPLGRDRGQRLRQMSIGRCRHGDDVHQVDQFLDPVDHALDVVLGSHLLSVGSSSARDRRERRATGPAIALEMEAGTPARADDADPQALILRHPAPPFTDSAAMGTAQTAVSARGLGTAGGRMFVT